jgi:chromosome transmission fidelity protein 18
VIAKPVTAAPTKDEPKKQQIPEDRGDGPPLKKVRTTAPKNFLGIGAQKAKAARTARQKALVGFSSSRCRLEKLSNTGSGLPLKQVIRFKYQKGFTQAVRTPCRIDELM